jgi:hypothetical protein
MQIIEIAKRVLAKQPPFTWGCTHGAINEVFGHGYTSAAECLMCRQVAWELLRDPSVPCERDPDLGNFSAVVPDWQCPCLSAKTGAAHDHLRDVIRYYCNTD